VVVIIPRTFGHVPPAPSEEECGIRSGRTRTGRPSVGRTRRWRFHGTRAGRRPSNALRAMASTH